MIKKMFAERKEAQRREARRKTIKNVGIAATVGTSVGVMGGVLGGVLFAPKSGKETRDDIKNKAIETNETIKIKATELKGTLNEELKNKQEVLLDAKSRIKAYLEEKKAEKAATTEEIDALEESLESAEDVQAVEEILEEALEIGDKKVEA